MTPGIAIVGAGAIGRKHAAALAASGAARLVAVVDPAPAGLALAVEAGVTHATDLSALPAGVEGVILATPTPLHLEQALVCIDLGVPVLVEKPVTPTAAEAATLVARASAAGVPVLVGHHRRHNPRVVAARAAIEAGALGRVIAAHASVLLLKPEAYFLPDWRRQPGAGPILTNLVHEVDTLRHLLGEVDAVLALASNAIRGFAVEDSAAAVLRFASGALATLAVSDAAAAPWSWELTAAENSDYPPTGQTCLTITGTDASLELPGLRLWRPDGPRSWYTPMTAVSLPVTDADPLVRQIDHFAAVIRGEARPLVGAADAARSLAVVEAILNAARNHDMERTVA
ncbi:MAG: Gfo/Idh/MocA family oxidoreductase [Rhodobacteraceae bacterium]|nr:Gfo/Idh/MocA family oxidoreductase [Paracoccaceae bacterium]